MRLSAKSQSQCTLRWVAKTGLGGSSSSWTKHTSGSGCQRSSCRQRLVDTTSTGIIQSMWNVSNPTLRFLSSLSSLVFFSHKMHRHTDTHTHTHSLSLSLFFLHLYVECLACACTTRRRRSGPKSLVCAIPPQKTPLKLSATCVIQIPFRPLPHPENRILPTFLRCPRCPAHRSML